MNSTPIQPSDFFDEGAYVGNLFDFINEEEYNEMLTVIDKVKDYSITNRDDLRCRYMINLDNNFKDDYKHSIPISEVEPRDQLVKEKNLKIFQKWFEYQIKHEPGEVDTFEFFIKHCKKILDNFYPGYEINYGARTGGFTLYEDGHFISDHKDGNNPGRVCVIIMYLSPESEYESLNGGGELIVRTNSNKEYKIKPILGTFTLLDFSENDIHHQVLEVKNGFKRYAFINFFYLKEGQTFVTNKKVFHSGKSTNTII